MRFNFACSIVAPSSAVNETCLTISSVEMLNWISVTSAAAVFVVDAILNTYSCECHRQIVVFYNFRNSSHFAKYIPNRSTANLLKSKSMVECACWMRAHSPHRMADDNAHLFTTTNNRSTSALVGGLWSEIQAIHWQFILLSVSLHLFKLSKLQSTRRLRRSGVEWFTRNGLPMKA